MLRKKFHSPKLYNYWPTRPQESTLLDCNHELSGRSNHTPTSTNYQQTRSTSYQTGSAGGGAKADTDRSFDWLTNCLISMSPVGDCMLVSDGCDSVWLIRFKCSLENQEIGEQFFIKSLNIDLFTSKDRITSILCLPIMSGQRTGLGTVDWTVLIVGFATGHVRFFNEQSSCLICLKFCDEPVVGLSCQTMKHHPYAISECHYATLTDELTIVYKSYAIVIDGFTLYENLKFARIESLNGDAQYGPSYDATTLPHILNCKRWKFRGNCDNITTCDNLGLRKRSTFDLLVSCSSNNSPDSTKQCGQSMIVIGRNPFIALYREESQTSSVSYSEWIGSLVSIWNKPAPPKTQTIDMSSQPSLSVYDRDRTAEYLVMSPDRRLVAATDSFGRVTLFDVTNCIAVRQWKGYRSAQCGWIEVPRDRESRICPRALFLVIYAPKRGLLEIWSCQKGPRVAAFNVGKNCRLLYQASKMFNQRAELLVDSIINPCVEHCLSQNCYLLNPNDSSIYVIDTPFTCSLAKDSDIKSRDNLLLVELDHAMRQDLSDTGDQNAIDDANAPLLNIMNRITMYESRQTALRKLLYHSNLTPIRLKKILDTYGSGIQQTYERHHTLSSSNEDESIEPSREFTDDDRSLIELCDRIKMLCNMFITLTECQNATNIYPKIPQARDICADHPEIEKLANKLKWSHAEVLRTLSVHALELSFKSAHQRSADPWPNLGEPIDWAEFLQCFNLEQFSNDPHQFRLTKLSSGFVTSETVSKIASLVFTYSFSHSTIDDNLKRCIQAIDAPSRMLLLFQYWLMSRLCNYWTTWPRLQQLISELSDILVPENSQQRQNLAGHSITKTSTHVETTSKDTIKDDLLTIETWKQVYALVLESDNLFGAIVATVAIKSDIKRVMQEVRQQSTTDRDFKNNDNNDHSTNLTLRNNDSCDTIGSHDTDSWENLCIDAERLGLLSKQLEDVLFLQLLLHYSPEDKCQVAHYVYPRMRRISVANVLRAGETCVSELVAQWALQSNVNLRIFVEPYRGIPPGTTATNNTDTSDTVSMRTIETSDNQSINEARDDPTVRNSQSPSSSLDEQAQELLHHVCGSFPASLEPDIVLANCFWEACAKWCSATALPAHESFLRKSLDCLSLLSSTILRHKFALLAWRNFFQRRLERLAVLTETNNSGVMSQTARTRDSICKQDLNMSEDSVEGFVRYCCDLTELMLQTHMPSTMEQMPLFTNDDWWSTATCLVMLADHNDSRPDCMSHTLSATTMAPIGGSNVASHHRNALFYGASSLRCADSNVLLELNRLCTILYIVFRLNLAKAYPLSLIGSDGQQVLRIDLHGQGHHAKHHNHQRLEDIRYKFVSKCIVSLCARQAETYNRQQQQDDDDDAPIDDDEHNEELMTIFDQLVGLAREWSLDCDAIHRDLVCDLYRNNCDTLAAMITTRVADQTTLAHAVLRIASQRVLVLVGLSVHCSPNWRANIDQWSLFSPSLSSWLKSVQQDESERKLAPVKLSARSGSQLDMLRAMLEYATNHLSGQASRTAYDLINALTTLQQK
ncbi:Rab3 GTPase-activating protein non-catalytic subunit [Fragariocoptes setiger]|uniref:Rab3 GTPase-activating protein non-catalytic subunit n=1 Tax=Fragariocoptes setiger TaxID=1670756 RepID=A0ABQ7SB37_9ACAR|nr:Rab3 GTPase-activating protein non-catalytic subunit [Fragariocoptes setiger]